MIIKEVEAWQMGAASLLLSEQSAINSVVTLCQSGRVVRSDGERSLLLRRVLEE